MRRTGIVLLRRFFSEQAFSVVCAVPAQLETPLGTADATAGVDKVAPHAVTSQPAMKIETIAVHAGHSIDSATGAVAAPIYLSTTFERDVEGKYSRGFMYSRNDNPNRQTLERGVSMLEGGEAAAAFASGTGAAM